ncbi:GNAT family N-acetyltransferase [Egicoccus halophilus]|uniref:N-acetyltransferase domain-containing protein n=1 Tax=Egicoccus halophilus TaxID=1670830 RepID=A0A8J3ACL0_9ACTN|nr:GNAT family N-acetyltransferase [Egicoccus halophilus]GGI08779.1 hypothetical protein GCM10011354_30790 [Egicoccus halophilus]
MHLRPAADGDLEAMLARNAAEVPDVGPLTRPGLVALLAQCELALVAVDDDGLLGLVLALAPGSDYASPNYRFFEDRGSDHLYVDRVAVAPRARRRGVASRLYDAVEERARATGRAEVTCEVNVEPPNEVSLAFHRARGFVEVGRQWHGDHRVALLARELPGADAGSSSA